MKKFKISVLVSLIFLFGCFIFISALNANDLIVSTYYGKYDSENKKPGFPSGSLEGPTTEKWITPKANKNYHIGVLFPHIQDSYWLSANYGTITHAKELGLKITLHSAGGYVKSYEQKKQLVALAKKTDGIILASTNYSGMDKFVSKITASGVPVIGLINDIIAPTVTAKAMVSFFEMGYKAGEYVLKDSSGKNVKVAFFPGPEKSGWAPETYTGFLKAISEKKNNNQNITILPPYYGDTRPDVQRLRLKLLLDKAENSGVDYIVGCAVAAIEAIKYLAKNRDKHPKAGIISTYITPDIFNEIEQGNVIASPSDQTIVQCKIALDMIVRTLNGEQAGKDFPFRAGAVIPVISKENIKEYRYEELFGQKGYVPIINDFLK